MEWQQLEYFHTVARLQHMTLAAQTLCITQPALSRSIARLEKELGVPLFERNGRAIVLNRYGRLFLNRVNRIMNEYQEGKRELEDLIHPEHGEVSLGFLHTLGVHSIPDVIRSFRSAYPQIHFQLHQNSTQFLLDQLSAGGIDLCMAAPQETKHMQWASLWNEELFVIVPKDHPLAASESVLLEDIRSEPLISFKKGYGLRKITDKLFEQAGIGPDIRFEGDEVHTIAGLVAAGLGVAVIPDTKGIERANLSFLRVRWPECRRVIGIGWIEGRYLSPAAERFRDFVIDYFRS
ncbi:LysR family transcriptional regulator [Paenibacillus tyrfis]|uniref:LysR family transcriptional regulator n=1 Tax=Paenibacillus tyrfis TaxID=1501230 RepID=UPI0020A15A3B|nr:LysR family transcriptional regulator [Paenibacillus tyrfis]MCP1308884.1 LysR family transcriptional regulator [Paenibacillus tyrfis]